ncbi:potassium transporter TrkG [Streptomyces sp. NPDC060311]|uniref:potassium transporter TrkG n=1 Tax=Streptomyces sp. NPDC060311 TaxID=3347096 RepID=UPI00365047DA
MTMASLLALPVSGKLRLELQLTAQAETKSLGIGDVRRALLGVAGTTFAVEAAVGAALSLRLRYGYGFSIRDAMHHGYFHANSAFHNAGFGLRGDSLTRYADAPWITLPIAAVVILGGLGFPVLLELLRRRNRHRTTGRRNWTLHTRLTLITTAVLLVTGTALTCLLEWSNSATLGNHSVPDKVLNGFFHSAMSRTAGFNSIDIGAMGRRLAPHVLRQALTVALMGVALAMTATLALLSMTSLPFEGVLFEAVSAFGTQ